jgi:outer membrane protein insertion porin family
VINVLVEEQSTGEFSVMGGFSTANGWMAQASVAEHNLFGTGRFAKTSVTYGQYVRAAELSFVEPYLLDQRISGGMDLFARQTLANVYLSYGTETYGGSLKLGVPLREDLSLQVRYSLFSQKITLPSSLDDCQNINPNFSTTFPTPNAIIAATAAGALWPGYNGTGIGCFASSQASLPIRLELANGAFLTSMAGYGLTYNTLDNNKHPTGGMLLSFGQDFAGLGGDVAYMRTVADFRAYYEIASDLIGLVHLQGGNMLGLKGAEVRMLDDFKMGPNLVRGFQPAGIGPRDLTPGTTGDALGGTLYWGASVELQYPFFFLPKDSGLRGAVFFDSGSVWDYKGETSNPATGEINGFINGTGGPFFCGNCAMQFADTAAVRASVGASLIWDSPFGPLRFDFAYPLLKQSYDRLQWFQFGGGARF